MRRIAAVVFAVLLALPAAAQADLRERPDAKPGPSRREPAEAVGGPSGPLPPYDRGRDILRGPMVRNELRITVRSGSLIVGLLSRSTHGPETWAGS